MTKSVTKMRSLRCAYCRAKFKPPARGRRPKYCSASHRQRAYERRREARRAEQLYPRLALGRDIDNIKTKDQVERAIVDFLRRLGILPPAPGPKRRPPLRLVKDMDPEPKKP